MTVSSRSTSGIACIISWGFFVGLALIQTEHVDEVSRTFLFQILFSLFCTFSIWVCWVKIVFWEENIILYRGLLLCLCNEPLSYLVHLHCLASYECQHLRGLIIKFCQSFLGSFSMQSCALQLTILFLWKGSSNNIENRRLYQSMLENWAERIFFVLNILGFRFLLFVYFLVCLFCVWEKFWHFGHLLIRNELIRSLWGSLMQLHCHFSGDIAW